ncbi:MAG: DUF1987 domain-containing protein [Bacteroidales bacterium]|nr:DUF1987 domain-containing protein [Bacteroidales bacterium]
METLTINGTLKTPEILLNAEKGMLEFKGRSIPENSTEFYKPVFDWINEYSKKPKSTTSVKMHLEYFNTSSSKCILDIFKKLEKIKKAGNEVSINWYYDEDDEDMLEAGEDYESIIKIPFKMIEVID